ncbi:MAG: diaminopimelate epimerase [Hamadaea sp.]|uniref:diaminopimelate epimerase n=1 Tax=Hamadaea sp. TaxID=2024425 RepID=UPI0017B8C279|nr:diaminopimelate epimerase [Hamadaea sp.]NUT19726.1 diaminopimelate epimerase [Hamadaea sp.]
MAFAKGHGTGNDFVIVDGDAPLTPELVAALCDRHFGVGADGVLRALPSTTPEAAWFMDYWNSDGSLSEMCGNGVRVFARHLVETGRAAGDGPIPIATRAGLRTALPDGPGFRVDMGAPVLLGTSWAQIGDHKFDGIGVSMGNPHLVCPVPNVEPLRLWESPAFDSDFYPEGVNVEFYEILADDHLRMRVYERGSGETLSCGTGTCAVAFAYLHSQGRATGTVTVDVPGGRLVVDVDEATSRLAGPAVIVGHGFVDTSALRF